MAIVGNLQMLPLLRIAGYRAYHAYWVDVGVGVLWMRPSCR
jgi:hypothetical protein